VARSGDSHERARLSVAVEVDRVVNASGLVALSGRYVSVGQGVAGYARSGAALRARLTASVISSSTVTVLSCGIWQVPAA
jgi:hypothetical protein